MERIQANRAKRLGESEINFRLSQNPLNDNVPGSKVSTESEPLAEQVATISAAVSAVIQPAAGVAANPTDLGESEIYL